MTSSFVTCDATPDSDRAEGELAREYATYHPVLFLLRKNGIEDEGWRGTPFYWPGIRAQRKTPTAVCTAETID